MKRQSGGIAVRAAISIVTVAMLLGTACSSGSSTSGAKTTIVLNYQWSGTSAKGIETVISDFNASQNAIVVKGLSSGDTQKMLASMSSNNPAFDLTTYFAWYTGSLASKGVLQPLDTFMTQDKFSTQGLVQSAVDSGKYKGKLYSMPIAGNNYALEYNSDLLQAAGINPPTTASELVAAAKKLEKFDSAGNITQLGFIENTDVYSHMNLFRPMGANFWASNGGPPTPNTPENIAACNWYVQNFPQRLGVDKVTKFKSSYGDFSDANSIFYAGKVAMIVDGEWQAAWVQQNAPAGFHWKATGAPYMDGRPDTKNNTYNGYGTLIIPTNSKHPKEAWEFIKFATTHKPQVDLNIALTNVPSNLEALDDPAFNAIPNFKFYLDQMKTSTTQALSGDVTTSQYIPDLSTALNNADLLKGTCTENLQQLEQKVKSY